VEDENKTSKNSSDDEQVRKPIPTVGQKIKSRILYASSDSENEDIGVGSAKNAKTGVENSENGDIGSKNSENDSDRISSDSEGENKSSKNSSGGDHVRKINSTIGEKTKKRILAVDSSDSENEDIGIGNGNVINGIDTEIENSKNVDIGNQSDNEERKSSVPNLNSDSDSDASEVQLSFKKGNRKAVIESDSE